MFDISRYSGPWSRLPDIPEDVQEMFEKSDVRPAGDEELLARVLHGQREEGVGRAQVALDADEADGVAGGRDDGKVADRVAVGRVHLANDAVDGWREVVEARRVVGDHLDALLETVEALIARLRGITQSSKP